MPRPSRVPLVLSFLFLSGATGLVYELVWSRHLGNVLGNSGQAHAVVLATFMGGLALGAYAFGRAADRARSALRLYGLLELGVGLYALAFPWVLEALTAGYLAVAPQFSDSTRLFPRLLMAAASLVVPAMLMGGTLPALARHFTRHLGGVRRELARLYAVNSLGAAVGVFLAGVRLVPELGLWRTTVLAAAVNLLLAAGALLLSRRPGPSAERAPPAPSEEGVSYPRRAARAALFGVALSGFTAMLYEVTWIRLLAIVLGASTYAFTFILTAFILGIGLGSFWLMARRREDDALRLFGGLQVGLVVSVCAALPLYYRLPYLFWRAHWGLSRSEATWPLYQGLTFLFCCAVLLLPTFFMGASFPAAARAATASVRELGRQLGGVYLWNTLGTVSGAALGGLFLLPAIGMEGCFVVGVGCNLLAAGISLGSAPTASSPLRRWWPLGAGAGCAALYVLASSGWSSFVANADAFRQREEPFASFEEHRAAVEGAFDVRFQRDDSVASVLVGQGRNGGRLFMRINGKVDASNGPDIETQILAGHLGVLLHPGKVRNVLLVGAGAAITAGSILAHDVERVDMVEISPAVVEAARLFAKDNRHALDDPRLHVHLDDAKTFMALAPIRYDLVVSVPSNPWVAGVSGLFSKDFFELATRHLAPDGVVVQWVHTYESSEEILRLVLRTFRDTFPRATSWLGPQDLLFVGSRAPLTLDPERIAERMAGAEVKADLARIDADDLLALLARQVHSEEGQAAFAGEGPVNTDDLNRLEFDSPIAFYVGRPSVPVRDERRSAGSAGVAGSLVLSRWLARHPLTAEGAERIHRAWVRWPEGNAPLVRAIAEKWAALAPESAAASLAVGRIALLQDDLGAAERALAPLVTRGEREPELVATWARLKARQARARHALWSPQDASVSALLAEAEAAHPGHPSLARVRAALSQ